MEHTAAVSALTGKVMANEDVTLEKHPEPSPSPRNEKLIDDTLVEFDGPNDPLNALNWPTNKKIVTLLLYSLCTMGTSWASSVYTSGLGQIERQFQVGTEVAILGLTLYLLGNALGPLLWAPMSEAYGRKVSTVIVPVFGLMVFSFASAVSKDFQTLMITRFFAGVFGVAPLTNVGGVLVDMFPATQRGAALLAWSIAVISGPLLAPIVGGALVLALPQTGWRWTEYITGIVMAAIYIPSLLFIQESSPAALLARRASNIRSQTKVWATRSKSQEVDVSVQGMLRKYFIVPLDMMLDPIAFLINLYAAFVYAIIYLAITAFPIEFDKSRGWNEVVGSLPFLAILVGVGFGAAVNLWGQTYYRGRLQATGLPSIPEARLVPMMIGSFFFPAGLFICAWTSSANVQWIGFCFGAACIGLGFLTIFQSALNYIVDTYLMLAASALAANMFMRSILAAAFPLISGPMFDSLGLDWGLSVIGFLSAAMIPIPFLFYIFGKRLRARGKRSRVSYIP